MSTKLLNGELEAMASEEARRIYEKEFSYHNPYTREIESDGVPVGLEEAYYRMVENELALRGEKIFRDGKYFKISRYQSH